MRDDGGMRKWSHGITVGIGLGIALAGACKDDEGTGEVPEDDAPARVAAAVCDAWVACSCEDFAMFADRFDSEGDCRTEIAEDLQDDIDSGNDAGLTYQGACIGLWIDALDALDCATLGQLVLDQGLVAAVADIQQCKLFYGDAGPGDPCTGVQGSNGDSCERDLVCDQGTCAIVDSGRAEGENCEGDGQGDCATGLLCFDVDGDDQRTCTALPAAGATCLGIADLCDLDTFCDQADKTCRPLPAAG